MGGGKDLLHVGADSIGEMVIEALETVSPCPLGAAPIGGIVGTLGAEGTVASLAGARVGRVEIGITIRADFVFHTR